MTSVLSVVAHHKLLVVISRKALTCQQSWLKVPTKLVAPGLTTAQTACLRKLTVRNWLPLCDTGQTIDLMSRCRSVEDLSLLFMFASNSFLVLILPFHSFIPYLYPLFHLNILPSFLFVTLFPVLSSFLNDFHSCLFPSSYAFQSPMKYRTSTNTCKEFLLFSVFCCSFHVLSM